MMLSSRMRTIYKMAGATEQDNNKVPHIQAELAAKEREALEAIKEDLCEWLSTVLDVKITAQTFIQVLETGVTLCRLASLVQQSAKTAKDSGHKLDFTFPLDPIRCNPKAEPGSFHARDNASNFIDWCRSVGVKEDMIFESEGLVLHKDEKRVVLCLLDVARFADRVGIAPPQLVKYEQEFESLECGSVPSGAEEEERKGDKSNAGSLRESSGDELLAPPPAKKPRSEEGHREKEKRKPKKREETVEERVEEKVLYSLHQCSCHEKLEVKNCGHGKFIITKAGRKTTLYARLLSDRVMVRVGGGWDILDHFMLKHDPCRIHAVSVAETSPNSTKVAETSPNSTKDSSTATLKPVQRSPYEMPVVPKGKVTLGKHKGERES